MLLLCYSSKVLSAQAWLEFVVLCLQPFSFIEKNVIRRHSKHRSSCVNSLKHYMHDLTAHLENKIMALLPSKFTLVIAPWSGGDTHYVALFATFLSSHQTGY